MHADPLLRAIESVAPLLLGAALLLALLRHVGLALPAKLLLRIGLGVVLVLGLAAGAEALGHGSPWTFVGVWLLVGLPAFLAKRWHETAALREAERDRLRQARGQERRRAALPHGGPGHNATAPALPQHTQGTP